MQGLAGQMAISLGHATVGMPQSLLNDEKAAARVYQHACEAMSEVMKPKPRHPCLLPDTKPCMSDMGVRLTCILIDESEVKFRFGTDLIENV